MDLLDPDGAMLLILSVPEASKTKTSGREMKGGFAAGGNGRFGGSS